LGGETEGNKEQSGKRNDILKVVFCWALYNTTPT